MNKLEKLLRLAGNWQGKNLLWLSPDDSARESDTRMSIAPAINGKFVEVRYSWADGDKPQEGLILIGYEADRELATAVWADSWHMLEKTMNCQGVLNEDGTVDVRGVYAAPKGPDWGWRIMISSDDQNSLIMTMFNITPDGKEALAVKATYVKVD